MPNNLEPEALTNNISIADLTKHLPSFLRTVTIIEALYLISLLVIAYLLAGKDKIIRNFILLVISKQFSWQGLVVGMGIVWLTSEKKNLAK